MVAAMHRGMIYAVLGVAILLALPVYSQTKTPPKQPAAPVQAAPSQPAQPQRLGAAQSWIAYSAREKGGQICYIVGEPTKSEPANIKRDPVHLLVTHNTADKTSDVVSFIAGYPFKDGSAPDLDIGGKKFSLFTKDDTAWARDAATDKAIVEAMLKAKQAVIKGSSARGTATTDTYMLAGFGQVLAQIDKTCKVKR
jgi:invasion associated locus B (IalB) protein